MDGEFKRDTLNKKRSDSKLDSAALLKSKEACEFLNISLSTLYRRCKAGYIAFVKVKRGLRFELQALVLYIERHRVCEKNPS